MKNLVELIIISAVLLIGNFWLSVDGENINEHEAKRTACGFTINGAILGAYKLFKDKK